MLLCEQTTRRALGKKQAFQEEESYQTLVQHQLTPTVVSKQRVQAAIALRPVAQLQKSGPGPWCVMQGSICSKEGLDSTHRTTIVGCWVVFYYIPQNVYSTLSKIWLLDQQARHHA
jgi:hypothetical protein|eukprot:COSAG06_NODE_441_length_15740_cov_6.214144_6_plen_116_part_00